MIRLHASYGLKVPGAQEYSSQSYHASVEIEVADTALKDGLAREFSRLWDQVQSAVEERAAGNSNNPVPSSLSAPRNGSNGHGGNGHVSRNNGSGPQADANGEPATKKQVNFLIACAKRHRGLNMDQTIEWLGKEYHTSLEGLTKTQAGRIIDTLQGKVASR